MRNWINDILIFVAITCIVILTLAYGGYTLPLAFLALLFTLDYRFPDACFIFVMLNGLAIAGFWPGNRKWLLVAGIGCGILSIQSLFSYV